MPSLATFGDGTSKEVVRVKWGHKVRAKIRWDLCPHKKKHQSLLSLFTRTEERPCEDIAGRQPSTSREERPCQKLTLLWGLALGLLAPITVRKLTSVVYATWFVLFCCESPRRLIETLKNASEPPVYSSWYMNFRDLEESKLKTRKQWDPKGATEIENLCQ